MDLQRALLDRKFLAAGPTPRAYRLTDAGQDSWRAFGMVLPEPVRLRDVSGRACIDWTERRHHLGGALGTALFARLKEIRWVAVNSGRRTVRLTHPGAREFERHFGIAIPR